ncbi:unnamed protein product [marine sediment metagenome]|uniref:Uncharacterized protein n=1 Tax=marine sediment metagenome TaxID=412755 RepID=X1JVR0_9ZZZZ
MRSLLVVSFVVAFVVAGTAQADVFGLGPTLLGEGPALVAEQRGASGPLPTQIVGLEGYALWGHNAGAAAAVTYKHRFGSSAVGEKTIRWRYGLIGGFSVAADNARGLVGGFVEAEIEGLVGFVLVIRADDGLYVNPGMMINLVSVSF